MKFYSDFFLSKLRKTLVDEQKDPHVLLFSEVFLTKYI